MGSEGREDHAWLSVFLFSLLHDLMSATKGRSDDPTNVCRPLTGQQRERLTFIALKDAFLFLTSGGSFGVFSWTTFRFAICQRKLPAVYCM